MFYNIKMNGGIENRKSLTFGDKIENYWCMLKKERRNVLRLYNENMVRVGLSYEAPMVKYGFSAL